MARNTYFSQGSTQERDLYEDVIVEALKIYGQEVYYLPRTIVSEDDILNEDIESKFTQAYSMEMYLENLDAFEGDGSIFTKFGLEIRDAATMVLARRTWNKNTYGSGLVRPNEGDLIYFNLTKQLMEVKFVEHEQPFYQLQNLPVFKLNIETYEYSDEAIDTGIDVIDQVELDLATRVKLTMASGGSGNYVIGETVTAADGANAEVANWDTTTRVLSVVGQSANFTAGDVLTGGTSGAVYTLSTRNTMEGLEENQPFADNNEFEIIGNNYIDFSEINPFGEIN
jgi:hypothetical protein